MHHSCFCSMPLRPFPFVLLLSIVALLQSTDLKAAQGGGNLLVNGSFESGPLHHNIQPGSTAVPGWVVINGDVDHVGSYWQAAHGSSSMDLHGSLGPGGMAQTVTTTPGAVYRVSFALAGHPLCGGPSIRTMTVEAAGQSADFSFDISGYSLFNMGWTPKTFIFIATGPQTELRLFSTTPPGCGGPAIDAVVLEEIPGLPHLTMVGGCPGQADLLASGMTPTGAVGFLAGGTGNFVVGRGGCAGTPLGMARPVRLGVSVASGNGIARLAGVIPPAACGTYSVVAMDLATCAVTSPLTL